jgi:uncharacterized protein with HEPN domain
VTDDRVYLGDILERIERIEAYTHGGREEFLRSLLIQDVSDSQFRGDGRGG